MNRVKIIIGLCSFPLALHAVWSSEYQIPYAVYSFMKQPVQLVVYQANVDGAWDRTDLKWVDQGIYNVDNVQPKTVHQWTNDVYVCSFGEMSERKDYGYAFSCWNWPVKIEVKWQGGKKETSARRFAEGTGDKKMLFSSWSKGEPCRNFVHFIITPAGEILKVAQLFNDGSIILSSGTEAGMGYKIWPDRHVTMGPKPDANNCAQTYLPEEKNPVQTPQGQLPIIVNDGQGNGKLAWSTENWWQ